jgi:DeoR/GlpR family transcriptional regulator of sugar metabolism
LSLNDGLTEYNLEDALVKQTLLTSASQKIVVADSTKLGRTTFATVGPLSTIDMLITDAGAPPEVVEGLQAQDIEVVLVDG